MAESEQIMDHKFVHGYCTECGRSRTELVAYGHPDIVLVPGPDTGLSCSGQTTASEIESLRSAWRRDREKWERLL